VTNRATSVGRIAIRRLGYPGRQTTPSAPGSRLDQKWRIEIRPTDLGRVSKDGGTRTPWFETRKDAILTMRDRDQSVVAIAQTGPIPGRQIGLRRPEIR